MKHIHLDSCHSTQSILMTEYEKTPNDFIIVSTDEQTSGRGRNGKVWEYQKSSLALSCTLPAAAQLTLTSLEVGLLVVKYFQETHLLDLKLKWPNDILVQGEKCGGIIIQNPNLSKLLIIGLGLNRENSGSYPGLPFSMELESLASSLYQYFLNNRKSNNDIISGWKDNCAHLNKKVTILDPSEHTGIFKGIGPMGEAILDTDGTETSFFSGSLFF